MSFKTFPPQAHSASLPRHDCRHTNQDAVRRCAGHIAQRSDFGSWAKPKAFPRAGRTDASRTSLRCGGRALAHLQDRTRTHQPFAADAGHALLLLENYAPHLIRRHQGNDGTVVERRGVAALKPSSSRHFVSEVTRSPVAGRTRNIACSLARFSWQANPQRQSASTCLGTHSAHQIETAGVD